MADRTYPLGATSVILRAKFRKADTGQGLVGLAYNTSGLIISTICDNEASATTYTQAGGTIEDIATLGTYAAPTSTKCRFKKVDDTNHPGTCEIHLADARFAVSGAKILRVSILGAANLLEKELVVELTGYNPYDAASLGVTVLADWVNGGRLDLLLDAIKTVTDKFAFTVANKVDSNALLVNGGTPLNETTIAGAILTTPANKLTTDASGKAAATIAAGDIATDAITAAAIKADAVTKLWTGIVEGAITAAQALQVILAYCAGKSTATGRYRNQADTKDRISATASSGRRTAVTLNLD
jgi:hypothetical protein